MYNPIKTLLMLSSLFLLSIQLSYGGGILVGRTRVIYEANKKEASLPLSNKSESRPFLIQSWTDDGDGKTRGPFVVTPPLFRLNANDESNLRITYTGGELPQDKESIFYINVRAIPSTPKNDYNELRLVIKTRIKLFYRPEKLSGKAFEAYKLLTFSHVKDQLMITNPTPYYVVFSYLKVGNAFLNDTDMIAPNSQIYVKLPANNVGDIIEWSAINDYGGDTAPEKRSL